MYGTFRYFSFMVQFVRWWYLKKREISKANKIKNNKLKNGNQIQKYLLETFQICSTRVSCILSDFKTSLISFKTSLISFKSSNSFIYTFFEKNNIGLKTLYILIFSLFHFTVTHYPSQITKKVKSIWDQLGWKSKKFKST